MNKLASIFGILTILFSQSCKEDLTNQSGIVLDNSKNFGIVSIQKGNNGEILCVGHPIGTEETVVKRYDRKLQLIETINLNHQREFNGFLTPTFIPNKGWVICDSEILPDSSRMTVYQTDERFNIKKKRIILQRATDPGDFAGQIYNLQILKNGDYLIVWDTSQVTIESRGYLHDNYGLRISRLNQNLESIFEYRCGNSGIDPGYTDKGNPRAIELEGGSIFFAYGTIIDGLNSINNVVGLIAENGNLLYQKEVPREFDWASIQSLSRTGNNVILSYEANNDLLNVFDLLDASSGTRIKRVIKPYNYYTGSIWGPTEIHNRQASEIQDNSGYLAYLADREKLYFMSINPDLIIEEKFEIPLPESMETNSFRQLITDDGTVIIGASIFIGNEENRSFVLLEMNLDGEVLQ